MDFTFLTMEACISEGLRTDRDQEKEYFTRSEKESPQKKISTKKGKLW
jgi:hypothetical protein